MVDRHRHNNVAESKLDMMALVETGEIPYISYGVWNTLAFWLIH
jgi:hypothetical protein